MSASERSELYHLARAAWGDRGADLLMTGLGDADDLGAGFDGLRADVRSDIAELRGDFAELRGDVLARIGSQDARFGDLEGQIAGVRGDLVAQIAGVRGDLKTDIGGLSGDLGRLEGSLGTFRGEVNQQFADLRVELGRSKRGTIYAAVTTVIALVSVILLAYQVGAG